MRQAWPKRSSGFFSTPASTTASSRVLRPLATLAACAGLWSLSSRSRSHPAADRFEPPAYGVRGVTPCLGYIRSGHTGPGAGIPGVDHKFGRTDQQAVVNVVMVRSNQHDIVL